MSTFENADCPFATNITGTTLPRWQRRALAESTKENPKTPKADRFIPNRSSMNLDACHFNLTSEQGPADATCSPSKAELQRSLKSNLFESQSSKILAFKTKAPAPREGFQSDMRVLYTQSKGAGKAKKSSRHIPQKPDRVLDAPEIKADFYLNPISWSSSNVLAVALNSVVYLWNATSGDIAELCESQGESSYVSSVSWSADGNVLSVAHSDATVQLWDVTRQKKVRTFRQHSQRVAGLAWNKHILSTGDKSGTIYNNDVRISDHVVATMNGHTQEVCGLTWSADGKHLASGGNDNVVNVWNGTGELQHRLTDHQAAVKALAWCPWQSNLLASGGGANDRCIRFWNASNGSCVNTIDTHSQVTSLLWSKEHKELVSAHGYSENQLSIWRYPSLSKVTDLTGHTQRVLAMDMSPDGSTVVSVSGDETLRFWRCFASDEGKKKKTKRAEGKSRLTQGMIR